MYQLYINHYPKRVVFPAVGPISSQDSRQLILSLQLCHVYTIINVDSVAQLLSRLAVSPVVMCSNPCKVALKCNWAGNSCMQSLADSRGEKPLIGVDVRGQLLDLFAR